MRYQRVLRSLRFKHRFPWCRVHFGARWHGFRIEPRVSPRALSSFEEQWGISLPETYCAYLETLGNGFAGPYYGVSPIEEWCAPENPKDVPADLLRTPFDPDLQRVAGLVPGAMRICNAGCEHYYLLVVSGRHTGEIWHDGGPDDVCLRRIDVPGSQDSSLGRWLDAWLDWILAGGFESDLAPDKFWTSVHYPGHAAAQVVADLDNAPVTNARTIAADQLPCPACVQIMQTARIRRFVVPALTTSQRQNPKLIARAAAQNRCKPIPLLVYP